MLSEKRVEELYRSHGPIVFRRARQILGSDDLSHDVVQEIFMSLLTDPGQFGGQSSVLTWLYSVTTHKCLNRLRNERTRGRILDQRGRAVPEAKESEVERALLVRDFLAGLPDELALVAVSVYLDGMSHEDMALTMQCSKRRIGYLLGEVRERAEKKGLYQ
jgi:RNA polymerase sigma factor (sigma-70 family)